MIKYKYYYTKNENDEVIDYFNSVFKTPTQDDVYDQERDERHYKLDLKTQDKKYRYIVDNGTIREKTALELEDDAEETEAKRIKWCTKEIKKLYNIDAELRLINLGITNPTNAQYLQYRTDIDNIITASYSI